MEVLGEAVVEHLTQQILDLEVRQLLFLEVSKLHMKQQLLKETVVEMVLPLVVQEEVVVGEVQEIQEIMLLFLKQVMEVQVLYQG
tara:strand:- start:195 stop:449 length:255 start_codon:yes stop_codon:yes gene_type:complete